MNSIIVAELNRLYKTDWEKYECKIRELKNSGYKILRNPQGDHRIESNPNFLNEVFGGVFSKIFK